MYSAVAAGLWVVGGAIVAISGTRYHGVLAVFVFIPSALVIIPWLGYDHGVWAALLAVCAAGSMLRWPAYYVGKYLISRVTGAEFSWPKWWPKDQD